MRKKIVIIGTTAASFYGFRKELLLLLMSLGHSVYAFISEYDSDDLDRVRELGAIVVIYKINRGGLNPIADFIATYHLTKQIKKISPDVVFSFFAKPVVFGTIAAMLANVPYKVGMLEGLGYSFTEQPEGISKKTWLIKHIQVMLYKWVLPQLNRFILLNKDDYKDLIEEYNIKVIETSILGGIGVDLDYYSKIEMPKFEDGIHFLFIARLLKEKGIHEFIEAAKIVKEKYPNTIFKIAGAIDESNMGSLSAEELEQIIDEGVYDYFGHVSDIRTVIENSHVFVLPSYREGVPRSSQEALAIGRAIITTDAPGCRETVIDKKNGFLVKKWDVNDLVDKMVFFIEQPELLLVMGNCSRDIAEKSFDAKVINQKLAELILN